MPKTASKKTIAVDIDDVLALNAQAFVEFSNKRWGTNLKPEDYTEHWAELWGIDSNDHEEVEKRALEFLNAGTSKYEHLPEAKEILGRLAERYTLVILTSRRVSLAKDTSDWIDKYFPGIFSDVHFAGIWDKVVDDRIHMSKGQVAKEIGADYLIDDQLKHCLAAAEAGVEVIVFGDYKWNQMDRLPRGVSRAKNWQEVLEYFEGRD